jgi:hypothetical protein
LAYTCRLRQQISLGTYSTKEEAAAAYDEAARKEKGESADCNFATLEEASQCVAKAVQREAEFKSTGHEHIGKAVARYRYWNEEQTDGTIITGQITKWAPPTENDEALW